MTNFSPDQTSFTAQIFVSTRPAAKPVSCTTSKDKSVGTPELFFAHAIQNIPVGLSFAASLAKFFERSEQNHVLKVLCKIIKNLKSSEAREISRRLNAPVRNIRKPVTLAQMLVESLNNAYQSRPQRKNIILTAEEFAFLEKLTQKSPKTINRALHTLRSIINELCISDPHALSGGVQACIEHAVEQNVLPELMEFYAGKLRPKTFEDRFFKRNHIRDNNSQEKLNGQDLPVGTDIFASPELPLINIEDPSFADGNLNADESLSEFLVFLKSLAAKEEQTLGNLNEAIINFLTRFSKEARLKLLTDAICLLIIKKPKAKHHRQIQPELFKDYNNGGIYVE